MNSEHRKILKQIRDLASPSLEKAYHGNSYLGSSHVCYGVTVPARRRIARAWLATQKQMPIGDFLAVVESLFRGKSHEEKTIAALLIGYRSDARRDVTPAMVDVWLEHLSGWAEIDTLCQNVFTAAELLSAWPAWRDFITRLARDSNINKRRASLVLLTGPVRTSNDPRFRTLGLKNIDRLKSERDILITKAISWLLRSMIAQHRDAVIRYLEANQSTLPPIALRETRTKIRTGIKSGRYPPRYTEYPNRLSSSGK